MATLAQLAIIQAQINVERKHQVELEMRRECQTQPTVDYATLVVAHADGRLTLLTVVTTKLAGDVLGQQTEWHQALNEVVR